MPRYDYACKKDGLFEREFSFSKLPEQTACPVCGAMSKRVLFYTSVIAYGTDKFHDRAFADASEALGRKITNSKQIDDAEARGEVRAITNPSRHRTYKEKK